MNPCTIPACNGKPTCRECLKLGYCPSGDKIVTNPNIVDSLLAMQAVLPASSRMQVCGSIAIITIGEHIPDSGDIYACIGFLGALERTRFFNAGDVIRKEKAPDL